MTSYEELYAIADRMEQEKSSGALAAADNALQALEDAAAVVGRAFSGSWLGYHANVYYADLAPPPAGARFSQEWGLQDMSFTSMGSRGDWREYDPTDLANYIRAQEGSSDLTDVKAAARKANDAFNIAKAELFSIIQTENTNDDDKFLGQLLAESHKLEPMTAGKIAQIWSPKGQAMTRDMTALGQRTRVPPHYLIKAEVASIRQAFSICQDIGSISRKAASHLERKSKRLSKQNRVGTNVFIGHGRSLVWHELKDFVQDRLHLPWDEFNRIPVAGVTNQARLSEMLDSAAVALVIMTAEDESAEGEMHARMNVVHEVGLFQGRLGFTKAIVLVEDGCKEFSNIQGLGQIRFPAGNIASCFEEVRRVFEREGAIKT